MGSKLEQALPSLSVTGFPPGLCYLPGSLDSNQWKLIRGQMRILGEPFLGLGL